MKINKDLEKITERFDPSFFWELVETPVYKDKVMQTRFFTEIGQAVKFLQENCPEGIYLMNHYNRKPITSADWANGYLETFCIRFAPKDIK